MTSFKITWDVLLGTTARLLRPPEFPGLLRLVRCQLPGGKGEERAGLPVRASRIQSSRSPPPVLNGFRVAGGAEACRKDFPDEVRGQLAVAFQAVLAAALLPSELAPEVDQEKDMRVVGRDRTT
jgi:hypothetical protein